MTLSPSASPIPSPPPQEEYLRQRRRRLAYRLGTAAAVVTAVGLVAAGVRLQQLRRHSPEAPLRMLARQEGLRLVGWRRIRS